MSGDLKGCRVVLLLKKFGIPFSYKKGCHAVIDFEEESSRTIDAGGGLAGVSHYEIVMKDDTTGQYFVPVLRIRTPVTGDYRDINLLTEPSPCILAGGIGGSNCSHYSLLSKLMKTQEDKTAATKPPYKIPSIAEIEALPKNGYDVASTFSGGGGSCFGYRMAGFNVVWANEFVPIAQESYRRNHPSTILDCRDIKQVSAKDVLKAMGKDVGELDVFDGSPPCQAFSTAGARSKNWGKDKEYAHGAKQKNEELFFDYIRLLKGMQPKTFVAENVSGLVKGVAKGYFLDILRQLKSSGYNVKVRVLDAKWLGVPQSRQRAIFLGVREDLGLDPIFPTPLPYFYTVKDALPWLGGAEQAGHPVEEETNIERFAIGKEYLNLREGQQSDKYFSLIRVAVDKPSPCISASHGEGGIVQPLHPTECRKFSIEEVKRICSFPDDCHLAGSYAQQWARLGNSVPPLMMLHVAKGIQQVLDVHNKR